MSPHSRYRNSIMAVLALGTSLLAANPIAAVMADAFTYQGELKLNGEVIDDLCDLRFSLWDAGSNGNQIGPTVDLTNQTVVGGRFVADVDFGPGAFNGANRWLQIAVRHPAGSGSYVVLSPRQMIMPTPYALKSLGNTMAWTDGTGYTTTNSRVGIGTNANQALHISGATTPTIALANTSAPTNQRVIGLRMESSGGMTIGRMDNSANNITRTDVTLSSAGELKVGTTLGGRVAVEEFGSDQGQRPAMIVRHTDTFNGQTVAGNFISTSAFGTGLLAQATATSGQNYGLRASSNSSTGFAAYFNGRTHFENGFVGVNRTSTISSAEVFGLKSNAAGAAYGGMYIDTSDNAGKPFYGFATGGQGKAWIYYDGTANQIRLYNSGDRMVIDKGTGNVGIGTTAPAERLHIVGGTDTELASGGFIVTGSTTSTNISMDNNEIQARNNGLKSALYLNHSGGDVLVGQNSAGTAKLVTPVLQITGGSDFSEMFDVGGELSVEPGMVVVIDPDNPGRLIPSTAAYDCKVAGVVSGAGGVGTGMIMGHEGTIASGSHPVALTGRVYCYVDASASAVEPGDMLTTSDVHGYAMKASDRERSHGTIIGKAMTSLEQGQSGLVLVLVNLQ